MKHTMDGRLNRRQAIAGLGGGLTAMLLAGSGCQSGRGRWRPLSETELDGPPRRELADPIEPRQPLAAVDPLGIVPRREWTSVRPTLSLAHPLGRVNRITVHHDGMPPVTLRTRADVAHRLEVIRRSHANRGWADIGYHYAIDPQGRVWEGRPAHLQGAHVRDHNENNLGILVLGNFDEQTPTAAALSALDAFLADRMRSHGVPLRRVVTHMELSPSACPGRNLQGFMVAARSSRGSMMTG